MDGDPAGLTRRQLLGRVSAGAGLAWVAPTVLSLGAVAAAGSTPPRGGLAGPDGPAVAQVVASGLGRPLGIFTAGHGVVYIADFDGGTGGDGRLLRFQLSAGGTGGTLTTLLDAAIRPSDIRVDPGQNLYFTDHSPNNRVGVIPAGTTQAVDFVTGIGGPEYLALGPGVLYVSESDTHVVRSYPLLGSSSSAPMTIGDGTVVAGNGAAPSSGFSCPSTVPVASSDVSLWIPFGLATDGSYLYVTDEYESVVYRVDLSTDPYQLTRFAGTCSGQGSGPGTGDGGPASAATVPDPQGIAVDGRGNVYILQISGQVRRVDAVTGVISTVYTEPGTADNNIDIGFDATDGSLYLTSQDTKTLTRLTQSP